MKPLLFLLSIILCLCSLYSCKKSTTAPKNTNETLQIIVTGARIDYSYSLSCTDITNWTNPSSPEPAAFWSTDNQTTDQTFTVNVYAGEEISFDDTFNGNYVNLQGPGTVATAKLNGTTLMTTQNEESTGGHIFTIPKP